jgi:hypothetical protein
VCGDLVIKGWKLAILPISRINPKKFENDFKNKLNVNLKKPATPSKACLQHQLHLNCGVTVRHLWCHV